MKFSISNKILTGFLIISIFLGFISFISFYYLQEIDESYTDLVSRRQNILANSKDIRADSIQQMSSLRDYMLNQDKGQLDKLHDVNGKMSELAIATLSMVRLDIDKNDIKKLHELNQQFNTDATKVAALIDSNKEAGIKSSADVLQIGRDMQELASSIADRQQKLVDEGSQNNSAMVASIKRTIMIISIAAFLLAILVGILISRIISKPIVSIANAAKEIASGNLTLKAIETKNRDEVGDLAKSFNQMVTNLRELIAQTTTSAEHLAAASEELTASAQQTNVATEQIATFIEEVATGSNKQTHSVRESVLAVNEMSSGAQHIAANAQNVSSSASDAAEKSFEGSQVIQQVMDQMNSIHQTIKNLSNVIHGLETRSQGIGEIVKMITDIAAQTNLLALNASIEAARAGEQGRGFAVVASQIRNLAEQSSQSSRQIAELILSIQQETQDAAQSMEASIQGVDEGILVVHMAGTSFEHIDQSIQRVLTQIQEVAASAEEMSASSEQVNSLMEFISTIAHESASGIQEISTSTEEQLASMEEIFSSASSLSQMAERLHSQIDRFKV
ncbi:hypothetical protein A8L34_24795 [Bacillus sp. FJAT-27264]|uniref:methyl-accepting chemotaxis protein n=1 Tax=Paenibacillus sp. (strain DSM 101736 / FJAT-27264) TaxID=1850362 RepID=UPI000807EA7E|nr:HAMP domain-containing methyl-accepting chemotaxis protein [Bacillus sp. FJAT-27264]OBZ07854.1 hypothetical protein A8L34_24795 [Bacillus sp. FJAT-27264]